MGTQVEVLESVSITKPKMEDSEFLNEVTSIDLFPSEVKILESKPNQSLEASNNEEQTANTPLANKIKVDQENATTEAGMGTNQGESFLKSSPVPNVATDDSSSTPEVFEIGTLVEEILKSQQVDIVASKEPSNAQGLISEEKLEESQRDERGNLMEDEIVMLATTGENVDCHQVIEVSEIKEEIMSTSSEKSSYEDTHEISYNSSKVKEMESEKTQNKDEKNGMLHNGNTDVPISATDCIGKETIENDDSVEENTGSPYVNALIEENNAEEAELEQGRKLSESSSVEIKEVWLNEKENECPNVDDKDESIEEQRTEKENFEGQLLESAGDETVRCSQEETAAQKGEESEIDPIEDILEVEMVGNKNDIQALASNTDENTAKSSPECETTREMPEQEVPRISIKGAEEIEFQTIEQNNTADVGPSAGEEIKEANLKTEETESDLEVNRTDKEIEEQNIEESANKTDLPSAVTGEEIAFGKLEDETDELKPKEEVKNVELENIESINVKSTIANMKDDFELDKDCVTQGSKGLSEEIHQKETNEDLVVSSSMPQVSQKETEDEDLDKEESAITELIEETSIMEAEQEHKPESNSSDLLFEENSKDIFAELAEANEIGENTNIQIPKTTKIEANEAGEETVCELEDKTYTTTPKGEDQREVTSGETSLSCISEKTLEESSAPSITDIQLGTTEVSATIERNAEITEISDINMQSLVTAKTTEDKSEKKENKPIDPTEDTIVKLKDIQMGNVNVEENPESVEPHEIRSSIELVAEEKSNEICLEDTQTKTDEDKENVNRQNLEAAEDEIFLASDTASEEKIYGEISQKCQNESEEVESKSEAELQMNRAAYRIEEINDVVLTEEVLAEVEKAEESEYSNEQVADEESCTTELLLTSSSDQEQNKVTSSDSVATENREAAGIIENTGIEELQEIEDVNWEPEISSIAKAPEGKMEGTENPVIITRSASELSEENIEEVGNNSLGVHAIPQGEAADNLESEDSSLGSRLTTREHADINKETMVVAKPDIHKIEVEELKNSDAGPIIEITETAKLQDIKCEPEASAIEEASEEEMLIGAEKPINFAISESALSEANTIEENIDEAETAAATVMTMETGSEGVQLANQSTRDMDTTAGDNDLGFDSILQYETVDAMELQDSSVISELATPEHADVNKEPVVIEKSATDEDEVEELKISDVEPNIGNAETEVLQAVEGTNWETEASFIAEAPEEEIMKGAEKPISITSSVSELSEENTRQEEIEEVGNHGYEAETAQATVITVETSSDGVHLANVSERGFDKTTGDNSLGSNAILHGEAVDGMDLQDSCLISQLAITKHADVNKETMVVEESATEETEVEEIETSNADPNSCQQNVHHIHESEKISTVQSSDTNTYEEETYEVLERKSETVEGITEQFQTPSYATLLGEQELQTTTTDEKVEDESTMKEETLVNEKLESTIATNPNEETCLRASEVEISTLDLELLDENDSLGESSTQETTDPQETRAEDPQVNISMIQLTGTISGGQENQELKDIEHISFQEHSIEETLDSANSTEGNKDSPVPHSQVNGILPEEAPYLDLQEIDRVAESASDLQRPEVLDKSEETEVKEEQTHVAATESRENENQEETLIEEQTINDDISIEKTEEIKEDAKDSSVVSLEVVHIQELAQELETIGENKDSTDEGKAAADTYQDLNADRADNSSCPQETEKQRSVEEAITTLDLQDTNWTDVNAEAKSPTQEKKNPEAYEEPTSASVSMVQDKINETPLEPNKVNVDDNSSNVEDNLESTEVKIREKDSTEEDIEMINEVATESQINQSEDCIEIVKDEILSEEIEGVTVETGEAKKSEDTKHEFNEEEICIRELQTTSSADGTTNEIAYSDPVTVEKLESKDLSLETKEEVLEAIEDLNLESEASLIEETSEKEVKQGTEKPANIISSVLEVSVEESGVVEYIDTQPETLKSETSLEKVHEAEKLIKGSTAENQIEKADEANDTIENTHSSEKVADDEGVARTVMGTDSIEELPKDLPWIVAQEEAEENSAGAGKAIANQDSVVEGTANENLLQEAPEEKNVNELPSKVETQETVNQTDFIEISEETIVLSEEVAYSDPARFESLGATDLSVETEEDLNSEPEALANEMNKHTENPVEVTSPVEVPEEENREEKLEGDNITDTPAVTLLTETISEDVQQGEQLIAKEVEAEELITSNRALASIGHDSKDVLEIDEVQEQMKSVPESIAEENEVANDYMSSASVPIEELSEGLQGIDAQEKVEFTSPVVEVPEEENREEKLEADNITDTPAVTLLTETISEDVQQGEQLIAKEVEAEELITSNRALAPIGQDSKDVLEIYEVQEQMKSVPESIAEEKEVANDYMSPAEVPIEELSEGLQGIDAQEKIKFTSPVVEVPEEENREEKLEADNITDTPAITLLTETISEDVQQGEQLNANEAEAEAEELITSNRALASIGQDFKDVFEIDEVQAQMKSGPESIAEEKEVVNDYISSASVSIEELSEGLQGIDAQEKVEEHITGSERSFVDSYQVSVAEGTANKNPPQETNKEKDVKKAQSELELQATGEEPEGIEINLEPIVLTEENLETAPHEELIVNYEYVANDQSDESFLDANNETEGSKDQNLESTVEKIIGEDFQEERSEMNEEVGQKLEEENEETQNMQETKRDVLMMEEIRKEAFVEIQEVEEIVNIKEEIIDSCTEEIKITSESDENLSEITNSDPLPIENVEVIESSVNTEEVNLLTAEDFSGKSGADFASKAPEEYVNQCMEKSTYNINSDSVEPKPMVNKENLEKADTDMNNESEILNIADADEIQVEESKEHDIEDVHRNGETTPGVSIGEDEPEGRVFETELKYQADETIVEGGKIADLIHLATNFTEKSQESSSSEIICREQDRETTTKTKQGENQSEKEDGTLVTELEEDTLTSRTIEAVLPSKENPNELQVSRFGFFEIDADKQNENLNEVAKEERSVVEEAAAVEPQEGEDNMKAGGSLIPKQMGIPGSVGAKCVEDASQDFQEIEEVLDFMPEAPSPNAAIESEGTEIEEVHPNTATISLMDEEYQSQIANEKTTTISKEVSSDKTTVEKEVAEDSVVVSPDEEKIRDNYLKDELETLDYPEQITNQELETTKRIPTEESSDELEKAGEIIEIAEHTVSEHIPTDEVYQDSFGDRTASEILPKELKDENNLKEAPTELNLQELNNETGCRDRNTEDETVNEESNVSELELIKHDKDQVESIEKNNLSQKYEVQSRDFEVSTVADVASEETTPIDEVEVLAIAYKHPVQEIIETYEAKTDVEKEDISNPKSVVNEKPEQTPTESTYGTYVATESLIQRDQEKAKESLDISEIEGKVDLTEVSEITLGVQMQDGTITKTLDDEVEELRAENDLVTELDTNRAGIEEEKIMVEETKEQREELSSAMFPLPDKVQTGECEGARKEDEEGDENQKMGSDSDAPVMIEVARDVDVKVHKKSHGILSGVGSKVKHSISKVKKVITGKSSHPKPPSPK